MRERPRLPMRERPGSPMLERPGSPMELQTSQELATGIQYPPTRESLVKKELMEDYPEDFKLKYMKYKAKYLELKNSII